MAVQSKNSPSARQPSLAVYCPMCDKQLTIVKMLTTSMPKGMYYKCECGYITPKAHKSYLNFKFDWKRS